MTAGIFTVYIKGEKNDLGITRNNDNRLVYDKRRRLKMIKKLEPLQGLDHSWLNKINELVDAVNELQKDYDNVCVYVGEQKLKTPADNKVLQLELDRTKKQLEIAVDALKYIGYDENDELDGLEEFAISQMIEKATKALEQIQELDND